VEQTLVLVKPDGVQRGLIGEIISRLEKRGLKMVAAKFMWVSRDLAEIHYAEHKGKHFYDRLIKYITSAPVMATVWEGPGAVEAVRQTTGETHPLKSSPGSIRHDFGLQKGLNLIHASDSVESGVREIRLWFPHNQLVAWERDIDRWIFE